MGKPTGFLEVKRQVQTDRAPLQRIKDWDEFHNHASDQLLQQQGSRCMDCGIPFCHTGSIIAGMASGCPINNLIPEWNDLVYNGKWEEAADRLHLTNNFPEFTGRVCPAPCEGSCTLGINQDPVTIKNIEVTISDRAFSKNWITPNSPPEKTGKKIAVIGSGPAGLACADQLNKVGHQVTVYERADRPGGLLMYGIPNMKLDKKIVQRRIDLMTQAGITFITNTEIGKDLPAKKLVQDFDSIVICTGATKPNDFLAKTPGRNLKGIHMAMPFLHQNTKSLCDSNLQDQNYISAKNKNVVVIGGGDTGTDCVGTSIRHGCQGVVQFEILEKPPEKRDPNNPWPQWPKTYRMDYGQEEAAALYGDDPRQYLIQTKEFIDDGNGNVKAVKTVMLKWEKDEQGRPVFPPKEIPNSEKQYPADLVLFALGFSGPEQIIADELGLERDQRKNYKAEFEKYTTNTLGVFTAGDVRRGQSLVVWAINEGRGAARECDRYLMGATQLP